jgi:predicted phage tail protein
MSETITTGQVAYDASAAIIFNEQAARALSAAADYVIDSDELLEAAGEDLRQVKALQKQVEEKRTSITGPLNAAVKAINELFRAPKDYLDQAEKKLKGTMLAYASEQERKAEEARKAAEAAARAERERLAAIEAEQQRQAQEAAAAAQRAAREAEEAAAAGDAEAAAQAQRVAAEQAAAAEAAAAEAAATAVTAEVITMPVAVAAPARVTGISTSKSVDFEIEDLHALVCHVAQHPELITLLAADTVKLRAQVRATGMNTKLPGVRVFEKRSMAARAA